MNTIKTCRIATMTAITLVILWELFKIPQNIEFVSLGYVNYILAILLYLYLFLLAAGNVLFYVNKPSAQYISGLALFMSLLLMQGGSPIYSVIHTLSALLLLMNAIMVFRQKTNE